MKIKISSGTPEVAVAGLGLIKTNEWVEVTKKQSDDFEEIHGRPLAESFAVQKTTKSKPKKEAS